jgi:alkanesulfonate monooxygenase SsuD/methylene tetrahydromethanopterin reductase-like flavin-dependent oxidoreductase (luciferase family)
VGRTQTGDDLTSTEEGGSYLSVTPAGSPDELAAQINRLREAFEVNEGRPPSDRDDAFWEAVNVLRDAYDGPELGSPADVMGGLS